MTISLNSNLSSLTSQRRLGENVSSLERVFERLASGRRINRASDDAAGLAVSTGLQSNARVYTQALRNANDGISALNIAEGTLQQTASIGMRLEELATSSANGSFSRTQRLALDVEAKELAKEFNRLVSTTRFNSLSLLDGTLGQFTLQLGYGSRELLGSALGSGLARSVGTGSFTSGTTNSLGGVEGGSEGVTGDFNGDGNLDIAAQTNSIGSVLVRYGDGNGAFSSGTSVTLSGGVSLPTSIRAADLNGDGKDDLIALRGNSLNVVLSSGSGFGAASVVATGVTSVAVLDSNGDGKQDLAYLTGSSLVSQLGNGNGTFAAALSTSIGFTPIDLVAGDFTGDGVQDLFVTNNSTTTRVMNGSGTGSFSAGVSANNYTQGSLAAGDFNQDGISDIVHFFGTSLAVSLGLGGGTFSSAAFYTGSLNSANEINLADINGDGYLDITGSTLSNGANYFLGSANGTFGAARSMTFSTLSGGVMAIPGDFNGDGVVDFAALDASDAAIATQESTQSSLIATINLTTRTEALSAMSTLEAIFGRITTERGQIGALQSRLASALDSISSRIENYSSASSRIVDADMAFESSQAVRLSILQQAAQGVLAQANQSPALALLLLE